MFRVCPCWVALLAGAMAMVAGGCSSSSPPISVSLSPPSPQAIDQSQTAGIAATVTNDRSLKGLSWSLTGPGSLSNSTGLSVTYISPAISPGYHSHPQPTGDGEGDVRSRSDEERFGTNHCQSLPSNSNSDTCHWIGGRAVQPNDRAHRRHLFVSMECLQRPDYLRNKRRWIGTGRTATRSQQRHDQRYAHWCRNLVFRGRRNGCDRRQHGQRLDEHPNQSHWPAGESGPILEPAARADRGFAGHPCLHPQRKRIGIRFRVNH